MQPHFIESILRAIPALLVIIGATRAGGAALRRLGQPAVIGELLVGILLGPSLLGRLAPGLEAALFPPLVMPVINAVAQVGIVLFMFLVGIEFDGTLIRQRAKAAVLISNVSVIVPFTLGAGLALFVYPWLSGDGASRVAFSLFVGVAFSVTAFPVLVRILTDFGMERTPIGTMALCCAAVGDVTAWCLLAVVTAVARTTPGSGPVTLLLALAFIVVMLTLVRPIIVRLVQHPVARSIGPLAVGLAIAAVTADRIGIHAIFGAFLFGAIIPARSRVAATIDARLTTVVGLFLPTFFAVTGLRLQISLISGPAEWAVCLVIVCLACAGKFGGSYLAARFGGLSGRDAIAIGALMNTRGLVELIVLNVGLDLRVVSPALFAMLVLMALLTTAATTPVLYLVGWRPTGRREASSLV